MIKTVMISLVVLGLGFATAHASASWFDKLKQAVSEFSSGEDTPQESSQSPSIVKQALSSSDMSGAFKQALEIGSARVVERLGQEGGFSDDAAIRIALPKNMQTVKKWLGKVGMEDRLEGFETRLNRAAEQATPKAKALFIDTIKTMTFEDVKSLYSGGDDAATRYFQSKMTPQLKQEMAPVVQQSLSDVGAVQWYDKVMGDYQKIPFVPDVKADLVNHVVDGGLDGVFHYLAKEEAAIRQNPVKRTTELLQRVFGQQ